MSDNQPADYEQTPDDQHARWMVEFEAARKALGGWQDKGDEIDREFRNEMAPDSTGDFSVRLPLFTSDVQTMVAMLFGQMPRAEVSRRFGDSDDDLARVGGEILERFTNFTVSEDTDTYVDALKSGLMDFFLPGFCLQICRYETGDIKKEDVEAETDETGKVLVEAYSKESRPDEDVVVDYKHWKDWLWGPAKVVQDVPWWAHQSLMTRAQLVKRFGAKGKAIPLAKKPGTDQEDPWSRGKIWEIYEKETRTTYWFCEAYPEILDIQKDTLGLEGFYPFPRPLIANLTTSKVVPRPYYALHQDQYRQINSLMSRLRELVDAVRVSGLCDKEFWEQIQKMLLPEGRGKVNPIPNWNKFTSSEGIRGSVEWFPLEQTIQAITVLMGQLTSEIDLLHQTTGFSDILRGEATQAGATATEQRVKARTGSVRIQRLQDQIAEYATNLLKVRSEIAIKHFSPETIFERANVRFMPPEDQALAMQAIELLKSDFACYRIEVKPESVALADFAAMKQERTEFLETLVTYFQAVAPIAAQMPTALEDLLDIAKWVAAGVRGSSQIEGVFDRMIAKAKQAAQQAQANPQQPNNPQVEVEKMKQQTLMMQGQQKMQLEQQKAQLTAQQTMNEVQADAQREANQRVENVREAAQRQQVMNALKPPAAPKGFP